MPGGNDVMLARLASELEERRAFQEQLAAGAAEAGRDLNPQEMELYTRAQERMGQIEAQLGPMRESARIASDSQRRTAELQAAYQVATGRQERAKVEYRSAGAYVLDVARRGFGDEEARDRLEMFLRAADHQTTTDNPGLLPETIVAPVVNRVDAARPIVSMIGPTDLGSGSWAYAKVTQHTEVAAQSAEKAELASQKMTITKTSITPVTYGGYVNVSRQDIQRTSPQIMDMVIADLAQQYAIVTENAAADDLYAGATAGTNTAIVAASTAAQVAAALWVVAGQAYTAMQGAGSVFLAISPDLLGLFGPLFGVNQVSATAPATGFSIGAFGSGPVGQIGGIPVVVSAGMNTNRALLVNSAAVRIFEHRYGALQVGEPSVLGTQVAYAGDFETVITDAGGVIAVDTVA